MQRPQKWGSEGVTKLQRGSGWIPGIWLRPGSHVRLVVLLCGPRGTKLMKILCELRIWGLVVVEEK